MISFIRIKSNDGKMTMCMRLPEERSVSTRTFQREHDRKIRSDACED